MIDIVALGEVLIDFTPSGTNELGMQLFSCNPGGAPANVLAMYGKLGGKTAFIGKVGSDTFGNFLEKTMKDADIDVSGLTRSKDIPTTLAFVQLDEHGERTFSFYRKPGADICLRPDEVDEDLLKNCRFFHFGSVSLTDEPSRTATLESVDKAKASGAIISYDPNYRPFLWKSEKHAIEEIMRALKLADVIKVSDEEMLLLTGVNDLEKGSDILMSDGAALVLVTLGEKGAYYRSDMARGLINTFKVPTVDTTGAGDAFLGALLHCLGEKNIAEIKSMSQKELEEAILFANAAGSLSTTKKGAIPAMPSLEEIEQCMNKPE